MLAYATHRRRQEKIASPTAMALIVGGHAVALALLLTAKPELIPDMGIIDTEIYNVPVAKPPPPPPPLPQPIDRKPPPKSLIDNPNPIIELQDQRPITAAETDKIDVPLTPFAGHSETTVPPSDPPKPMAVTRTAARFATPDDLVRPPYPPSKQRLEEEASLRLRLSIDERGRVVAVDPIGATDAEFLAAARKHILRYWRYKPAMENGVAVASRTDLTLKFELDE